MQVMARLLRPLRSCYRWRIRAFPFWSYVVSFLALLVLLIVPRGGSAQSDRFPYGSFAFATASIPTIDKQVQEVSLVLTVTNKRGHFVRNLNQSDFNILDNGHVPKRITYFQPQTQLPLRVALVIDTSDSVTYRFKFEQQAAASFFRRVLHAPTDLGSVIGFNQEVHTSLGPTDDTKALDSALKRLHPGGETAIYDAVIAASEQMASMRDIHPVRHAIVVITDGEDNRSHAPLDQAVTAALHADSIVYVVSTTTSGESVGLAEDGDNAMKQLAEATGGRLLRGESDGDVSRAFSKIETELRSQYAIGYKPANAVADGLFHRLIVLGPKKLHICHRLGYFAR